MIQMRGAVVCCRSDLPVATAVVVGATSRSRFLCEFTDCNGGARCSAYDVGVGGWRVGAFVGARCPSHHTAGEGGLNCDSCD